MKQGWHSILRPGVQGSSTSFIGGKPCIPPSVPLPVCKICGEPLTFFFQVAFPEGHMWAGKSLAFFFCSATYHKERPASYGGKPMGLILQVAENFNFDKLPDAPPEMKKSYLGNGGFKERTQPNYTLFYEFNRVYLWGPEDPSDPVVYINVQNDI